MLKQLAMMDIEEYMFTSKEKVHVIQSKFSLIHYMIDN